MAEDYLLAKGYTILHRNWRTARKEVDLIARNADELVFIEIKTRSGLGYGFPEESVSTAKQTNLRTAAEIFLEAHPHFKTVRFDVISIILRNGAIEELRHLQDAF